MSLDRDEVLDDWLADGGKDDRHITVGRRRTESYFTAEALTGDQSVEWNADMSPRAALEGLAELIYRRENPDIAHP